MLEVNLGNPEDFLVLKETLSRMGVPLPDGGPNTILQQCHILHKKGRYFVVHVNELRILDGEDVIFSEEDLAIRDSTALLLEKWGLCELTEPPATSRTKFVTVAPFRDKAKWRIVSDYDIGKVKSGGRRDL